MFGRKHVIHQGLRVVLLLLLLVLYPAIGQARSVVTPWQSSVSVQNLVIGASSTVDVHQALGAMPDDIVKVEQMFPVLENHYYYDENGSGAATVFVFENQLLVAMFYKSPSNQFLDLTYFIQNIGDRGLNNPLNAGFYSYYPYLPLYGLY